MIQKGFDSSLSKNGGLERGRRFVFKKLQGALFSILFDLFDLRRYHRQYRRWDGL